MSIEECRALFGLLAEGKNFLELIHDQEPQLIGRSKLCDDLRQ